MPMASYAPSPWELGPFRPQTAGTSSAAGTPLNNGFESSQIGAPGSSSSSSSSAAGQPAPPNTIGNSQPSGASTPSAAVSSQSSLSDLTTSPKSRGSFSSATSSTLVGSRGSLSLGSAPLVSGSRSSLSSFASIGSLASQGSLTAQQQPMMDDPKQLFGAQATLVVNNMPREMTARECQLLFALAPDLVSTDVSRNAVSGELTVYAKFYTTHSAQSVAQTLERIPDQVGSKVKVTLQTLPLASASQQPLLSQQPQAQRSIYPSRPLFAESYWSNQPMTPMSPLGQTTTSELFNSSRSASIVSPTDPLFPSQAHGMGGHQEVSESPFRQPGSHNGSASSIGSASSRPGSVGNIGSQGTGQGPGGLPIHQNSVSSVGSGSVSSSGSGSASRVSVPSIQPQSMRRMPPQNPADQNPPCNTLYVGNLPPDTSEAELKELFSTQPGYRRLCFRAKQNGPMCFVEFDGEALAGRALDELYGVSLSNSVKGGIRLSYSKNPLGVRSRTTRPK